MSQPTTLGAKFKSLLVKLLIGLALGVLVWEFLGRTLLGMKFGSLGSSVTCAPDVNQALSEFDSGLRISALVGAVLYTVLAALVRRWWRKSRAAKA